jgi:hypothetical protein
MYHHNEASLDLKVSIPSFDLGTCRYLISRGSRVLTKSLLDVGVGHRSWCGWHKGSWVDFQTYTLKRTELNSSSPYDFSVKFGGTSKPVMHYLPSSFKDKEDNQD